MRWEEVCENKQLQDLPFKIELNKWGQIVMSPVKIKHSFYQGRIQRLLESLLHTGEVIPECAINTSDSVKVAGGFLLYSSNFMRFCQDYNVNRFSMNWRVFC